MYVVQVSMEILGTPAFIFLDCLSANFPGLQNNLKVHILGSFLVLETGPDPTALSRYGPALASFNFV
jgi:hypothetical protein